MCTYETLVAATLPYGLMPLVVPQLKTITLGGAVTGLGIESTSFRNGLPHESVLEIDVLTGSNHFTFVVVAAGRANVMRTLQFATVRAFSRIGGHKGVMRTAHVTAGARDSVLRDSHV